MLMKNINRLKALILLIILISGLIAPVAARDYDIEIDDVLFFEYEDDGCDINKPEYRDIDPKEKFCIGASIRNRGNYSLSGLRIHVIVDGKDFGGDGNIPVIGSGSSKDARSSEDTVSTCGIHTIEVQVLDDDDVVANETIEMGIGKFLTVTHTPEFPIVEKDIVFNIEGDDEDINPTVRILYPHTEKENAETHTIQKVYTFNTQIPGEYKFNFSVPGYCTVDKTLKILHNFTITRVSFESPVVGKAIQYLVQDENYKTQPTGTSISINGPVEDNPSFYTAFVRADGLCNFTLPRAGTYRINISNSEFWAAVFEIYVADKPKLKVSIETENPYTGGDVVFLIKEGDNVVEDAEVTITDPDKFSTTIKTNEYGKVKFTPKITGEYEIKAEKEEHEPGSLNIDVLNPKVNIEISPLDQKIGDTVTVRVSNREDLPISGAMVYVTSYDFDMSDTTDYSGKISFNLSYSGDYKIRVKKENYAETVKNVYLGNVEEKKSLDIELSASTISFLEDITITVNCIDSAGKHEESADLVIIEPGGEQQNRVSSRITFTPERAGEYTINADSGCGAASAKFTVNPVTMKLSVVKPDDKKLEDNKILVMVRDITGRELEDVTVVVKTPGGIKNIKTDENGVAYLEVISEGTYTFSCEKENYISQRELSDMVNVKREHSFLPLILILPVIFFAIVLLVVVYYYGKIKDSKTIPRSRLGSAGKHRGL